MVIAGAVPGGLSAAPFPARQVVLAAVQGVIATVVIDQEPLSND